MSTDVTTLSDDDLMSQWTAAGDAAAAAKETADEFANEFHRRETQKATQARYDSMSENERAALAQMFEVQGIASQESVSSGEETAPADPPAGEPAPDPAPVDPTNPTPAPDGSAS